MSHLQILGGDDDLSGAVGGEAVRRREASARRWWRRRLGGFLCTVPGHAEIDCKQKTTRQSSKLEPQKSPVRV